MSGATLDAECQRIFDVAEEERSAMEAGDLEKYFSLLSDDAVFLPQNDYSKTGAELRQWLSEFVKRIEIRYVRFAHGETIIREDLACHEYTCAWTATPRQGGQPRAMAFKGLHVLRKEPNGTWRISRSIWNTDPAGS